MLYRMWKYLDRYRFGHFRCSKQAGNSKEWHTKVECIRDTCGGCLLEECIIVLYRLMSCLSWSVICRLVVVSGRKYSITIQRLSNRRLSKIWAAGEREREGEREGGGKWGMSSLSCGEREEIIQVYGTLMMLAVWRTAGYSDVRIITATGYSDMHHIYSCWLCRYVHNYRTVSVYYVTIM